MLFQPCRMHRPPACNKRQACRARVIKDGTRDRWKLKAGLASPVIFSAQWSPGLHGSVVVSFSAGSETCHAIAEPGGYGSTREDTSAGRFGTVSPEFQSRAPDHSFELDSDPTMGVRCLLRPAGGTGGSQSTSTRGVATPTSLAIAPPLRKPRTLLTADDRVRGVTCAYVSTAVSSRSPSRLGTYLTLSPLSSSSVVCVWRRSWKRMRSTPGHEVSRASKRRVVSSGS